MTNAQPAMVEFPVRRPGEPFPPAEYAGYRGHDGLVRCRLVDGNAVWLVSRHEDVRAVLTSQKISSNPTRNGFPNFGATLGVPRSDQIPGWFVGLDPPDHDRIRHRRSLRSCGRAGHNAPTSGRRSIRFRPGLQPWRAPERRPGDRKSVV